MSPNKFSKLSKKILFSLISFQSHEVYQKVFFDYLGMTKGDLRRFFEKKDVLKNFTNFKEKLLYWSLFLGWSFNFIKKRPTQ